MTFQDNSTTRIELLKAYLTEDPNDPFMIYALALEYARLNKTEDAISLLEKVVLQNPDYLPAYYQLGKLYEKRKRFENSIETYTKGMAIARLKKDLHTLSELQGALNSIEL